ncbi:MAG: fibrobacter succinogenes major paralogous domain-containing protein [Bacteroidota bacterium]|nr:fibrobacter succinogenes major paralogous domain-containing protein [Bacteroidota bacterium]
MGEATESPSDGIVSDLDCPDFNAFLGCTFELACNYIPEATIDDGSCFFDCPGCTDDNACNFDPEALQDDGSCQYLDECGVCGGIGIPQGECDCNGTLIDALGVCGGSCASDDDNDGLCDDIDECVGQLDECGVCNGPGATYACGCNEYPTGTCDCDGNVLDECGVCGGAGITEGQCDCDGNVLDLCGVCGGDGIPEGQCDCQGSILDAIGVCGGDCTSDLNNNGICDLEELAYGCGPANCGQGTIWDESTQKCIPDNPSDLNFDGCVDVQDFMGHLAAFGSGCEEEIVETPWQCGDALTYQGYDYTTILIGEQCWFAENLRSENYENGDAIPANLSDSDWQNTTFGAVAVYGEGSSDCYTDTPDGDACDETWSLNEYGRLYNWHAVDDARGLCPSGWHVPTDEEWTVMTDFLGGVSVAGGQMKTTYGWYDGGGGTNSSGFSGLPGGNFHYYGYFYLAGSNGGWWSSSPFEDRAWFRVLNDNYESVGRYFNSPQFGFSVRCVRDAE